MTWFAPGGSRPLAGIQLFCLPYAGAGASVFRGWESGLGPGVEVLPVRLPGREARITEDPRFDTGQVAAAIAERADRPYAIYGHSMGGRLGFDVVRELRRRRARLPVRLYVGAARAPHVNTPGPFDGLSGVDDEELLRRLRRGGGLPDEVRQVPELVELLLPLLRADFARVDGYRYLPGEPLPVPIVALHGRDDRAVTPDATRAWARHTAAGFELYELDGGHFFLHDARVQLLDLLRADLTSAVTGPDSPARSASPATSVVAPPAVPAVAPPATSVAAPPATSVPAPPAHAPHRVPLGGTWSVWREGILRTTGFPADGLAALSAPAAARAADELIAAGELTAGAAGRAGPPDREPGAVASGREFATVTFDREFAAATRAGAARLLQVAADPLVREAITWQNPGVLVTLDALLRSGAGAPRTSRQRAREAAVLKYWQRYCGKNETVGFFGPTCWVRVDPDQPLPVRAVPGRSLTRERWVVFESWALDAYAGALGRDPRLRRWWRPARYPHLSLAGRQVRRPGRPPVPLSPVEAAVLAACDGTRPAVAIVSDPRLGLRREEDGYAVLDNLVERELITWDADLPVNPDAEAVLRERIAGIGDPAVRDRAAGGLDRLCAARDAVAVAAGDPVALRAALSGMDEVFTGLTGAVPARRAGRMYAGRRLCYEDTSRDLDVVIGRPLLDGIAAPLDIVLRAARWLANALQEAYDAELRTLYDDLAAAGGPVTVADLWFLAQGLFWGTGTRPVDRVAAEFAGRWARLFGLDGLPPDTPAVTASSAEIAVRVPQVFPARPPAWRAARLHSPDLQICAAGPEALARGEYTVVLGELHAAWASFDTEVFARAHPEPGRLRDALAADLGGYRIRLAYPADWPRHTGRVTEGLVSGTDRLLAFTAAPVADRARALATVDLTVSDVQGSLVATAPDGRRWPLIEVFSGLLAVHAVDGFKLVAAAPHTPRLTLDRLVLARRTWRTTVAACGLGEVTGERERYLAVRRWRRRLGLPEQVYVKLATETKPCFVDLTSPLYASLLCAMVRAARSTGEASLVVTEMLPTPDQAWVPDAAGRRYLSELRLHIVDTIGAGAAAGGRR